MEKKKHVFFRQALALLLCVAMLLPVLPVSAGALEAGAEKTAVAEKAVSPVEQSYVAPDISGLPAYSGGNVSQTMEYDCGNGVSGNGEKSYLTVVTDTTAAEFNAYQQTLTAAGFTKTGERSVDSRTSGSPNLFAMFRSPLGNYKVYTYFLAPYDPAGDTNAIANAVTVSGEVRIIVDTQKDTVEGFHYESTTGETAVPMLVQYGLSMSENGFDITSKEEKNRNGKRNCGALTVIRMADNSLFIDDGGDIQQWSDEACDDFMQFCRDITGKRQDETVTINTWFVSHAHSDHFLGLPRFIKRYHQYLDIKNVMYNIDDTRDGSTRDMGPIMQMVKGYFPNVRYYKPHTGESFTIEGIEFAVLYALEDRYLPNAQGELITDKSDQGGTYRADMYKDGESDFNDTTTVLKVHFENGKNALLYGDVNLGETVLLSCYPDSYLKTDIMMVPHHGHDPHRKLCEVSDAKIFLYTQRKQAIFGPDGDVTTKDEKVNGVDTFRPKLRNYYLEMQEYIEKEDSKTYWEGDETVCILMGSGDKQLPADMTKDADAPSGFKVYTREVVPFEYGGWTWSNVDVVALSGVAEKTVSKELAVGSAPFRLEQVTDMNLELGEKYVIVHNESHNLLMHEAAADLTNSLLGDVSHNAKLGMADAFFAALTVNAQTNTKDDTQRDISKLYFSQHLRDRALWILDDEFFGKPQTINPNQASLFGGSKCYRYTDFHKGATEDASYWYTDSDDADATFLLQPNLADLVVKKNEGNRTYNVYTEFFSDNTCVIYYHNNKNTDNSIRFLYWDSEDGWKQKRYDNQSKNQNIANIKADLDSLKLRLYQYVEYPDSAQNVTINGSAEYTVFSHITQTEICDMIVRNLDVKNLLRNNVAIPCSGTTAKTGYYWLEFPAAYAQGKVGDYRIGVKFRNDDGTDTELCVVDLHVMDKILTGYSTSHSDGTVQINAGLGAVVYDINEQTQESTTCTLYGTYLTADGVVTMDTDIKVTVGMLTDGSGRMVDTSVPGTYSGLTLSYDGQVVCTNFTLTVSATSDLLNYPVYPEPGSVQVNKTGKALPPFKQTGTANIQLSATGKPASKGVDLIVVMDLSGSMENGLDTDKNVADYTQTRIYAMEQALQSMVTMLKDSNADVRIAMSDFGDLDSHVFKDSVIVPSMGQRAYFDVNWDFSLDRPSQTNETKTSFEFSNYLNFPMKAGDGEAAAYPIVNSKHNLANPSYQGRVVPTIYTGSGELNAAAFVDVNMLDINKVVQKLDKNVKKSYGTNYDVGLEYAYQLGYAIQQKNITEGQDRELVCIFMSDGAAMQYNYFSGRGVSTTWADWITGKADGIETLLKDGAPYSDANKPDALVELENMLLSVLKAGKLRKPDSNRNNNGGEDSTKVGNAYYFNYYEGMVKAGRKHFYSYMSDMGYHLDWAYLQEIAEVNGVTLPAYDPENHYENMKLDALTDLLVAANENYTDSAPVKDGHTGQVSQLINPRAKIERYEAYTGTATDFFAAMEEIGVEMDWNLFGQIAYANYMIEVDRYDSESNEILRVLRELINNIKNAKDGYFTLSPYSYFYNAEGKNWWAEAIKGDPTQLYPVINQYAFEDSTERILGYYGDERNGFSGETTQGLPLDGKDYISGFRGLGIDLYTISFSVATDGSISAEDAELVLRNIATGPAYFYAANTEDSLTQALKSIVSSASKSASRAWYVDTMGPEFDLSTEKTVTDGNNVVHQVNAEPAVKVLEYTLDADGNRDGQPIVRETITFQGGKKATSDQVYVTQTDADGHITKIFPDIWDDTTNMINGRFVRYNANHAGSDVDVDGDNDTDIQNGDIVNGGFKIDLTGDGAPDYVLPAESFFWTIGIIGETEMVLEYQAYLTGSVEGTRDDDGVTMYPTNTAAVLNYINHMGVDCRKETISPAFPWGDPIVGYAFYLVDQNGTPLKADGTPGSFLESVKLSEIEYQKIINRNSVAITASDKLGELGENYWLYDASAEYLLADIEGQGCWAINKDAALNNTTYVSNYGGAPTNKISSNGLANVDLTRTVVWFALEKRSDIEPDQVVIDFGLPVKIDVLGNDTLQEELDVLGICAGAPDSLTDGLTSLPEGVALKDADDGAYGTLTLIKNGVDKNKLVYTPGSMEMEGSDTFTYAVQDRRGRYQFATVTVIPATTIYYEDDFVTTTTYTRTDTSKREWTKGVAWGTAGTTTPGFQGEHRPGDTAFDTVYGYDTAYESCSMYSLGSARQITVTPKQYGTAEFTFWGTGFDVISLSSSNTGFITVQVKELDGKGNVASGGTTVNKAVDTYYGYVYERNPQTNQMEWKPANGNTAIYQVPVMKVENLRYGQYQVTITASYSNYFDHNDPNATSGSYDFYLDAIRIYDPANPNGDEFESIENIYRGDGEENATYQELRNLLINANSFNTLGDGTVKGAIFVDGIASLDITSNGHDGPNHADVSDKIATKPAAIKDYANYGPNNEVYLAKGQGVAFELGGETETVNRVYLSLKAPMSGKAGVVTVYGIDTRNNNAQTNIDKLNAATISTATDLYFDITPLMGKTVVIVNTGDGMISVTNLKFAYGTNLLNSGSDLGYITMSRESGHAVLELLNGFTEDEVETDVIPEGTTPVDPEIPGTQPTEPGATEPEATQPEATEPEVTEPEATEPEATEPDGDAPDTFQPEKVEVELSNTSVKVGSQVMVTVTTGEDVAYLTVNGAKVTFFTEEGGQRIWRVRLTAKEAGGMSVRVVAYNSTGAASQTVLKILEVTDSYTSIGNWLEDLIIRLVSNLTK